MSSTEAPFSQNDFPYNIRRKLLDPQGEIEMLTNGFVLPEIPIPGFGNINIRGTREGKAASKTGFFVNSKGRLELCASAVLTQKGLLCLDLLIDDYKPTDPPVTHMYIHTPGKPVGAMSPMSLSADDDPNKGPNATQSHWFLLHHLEIDGGYDFFVPPDPSFLSRVNLGFTRNVGYRFPV